MQENLSLWFPTRSDTNQPVQSKKMVRGWKFWTYKVQELHYPCGENKSADQFRSYCEANLMLCFRIDKNPIKHGKINCFQSIIVKDCFILIEPIVCIKASVCPMIKILQHFTFVYG